MQTTVGSVRKAPRMSSTGYKHVYKNSKESGKPYYVAKKINKKSVYFGFFATIEDAVAYTMTLPPRVKKPYKNRHQPRNSTNGRFVQGPKHP